MEDRLRPSVPAQARPPSARFGPRRWALRECGPLRHAALGISTARTGGGKYVPEDIRFQILYKIAFRSFSNPRWSRPSTPGGTLIRLHLLVRLPHQLLRYGERLAFRPDSPTRLLPGHALVDRVNKSQTTRPLRSAPITGSFTATTSRSAGASRNGTQRLTAPAAWRAPSRPPHHGAQYQDAPSHVPHGSRRPGSRHLHAGHHLASKRAFRQAHPGTELTPRF